MKSLQTLRLSVVAFIPLLCVSLFAAPKPSRAPIRAPIRPPKVGTISAPRFQSNLQPKSVKPAGMPVLSGNASDSTDTGTDEEDAETPVTPAISNGPNTVDQSANTIGTSGNWVKKKDYLMRSFEVQQEIESLATQIQSFRNVYQQKFNAIDFQLDAFYKKLGLEQSKVQHLVDELTEYIDKKKQRRTSRLKENIVDIREQQLALENLEESLKINSEELAQLKADLKSIEDLDKSVNARMQKADDQITIAQREAARTQDIVQSMWDMLDDRRAKAAYFEIKDGILRKLQGISSYLQQDLLSDLEKVSSTINTQIKKAQDSVKQLEDKGFIIKDRSKRLEELAAKKAQEAADELAKQEQNVRKPRKASKQQGFFTQVYNKLVNFIADIYRFFAQLFGSNQPKVKVRTRPAAGVETNAPPEGQVQQPAGQVPPVQPNGQQVPPQPAAATVYQQQPQQVEQPAARQSFAKPIAPMMGQLGQPPAPVGMPVMSLGQ